MDFFSKKIAVTIVNAEDGKLIVEMSEKPENLPERFDITTSIHLGKAEFEVLEADPLHRTAYTQSRKLLLKVRPLPPVQLMDPKDILYLYSIPTLCSDLGQLDKKSTVSGPTLEMHEDDWRQVEFISLAVSTAIANEVNGIREIYEHKRTASGAFTAMHLRTPIVTLPNKSLPVEQLQADLGKEVAYGGITYFISGGKMEGVVENGYAFRATGGLIVYGQAEQGNATSIGIVPHGGMDAAKVTPLLAEFLKKHDLVLIDWCRAAKFSEKGQLTEFFETQI